MFDRLQARLSEPLAVGIDGFEKWTARIAEAVAAPSA